MRTEISSSLWLYKNRLLCPYYFYFREMWARKVWIQVHIVGYPGLAQFVQRPSPIIFACHKL